MKMFGYRYLYNTNIAKPITCQRIFITTPKQTITRLEKYQFMNIIED
jgi:hypothetical protein